MPSPTVDVHNHGVPAGLLRTIRAEGERYGASVDSPAEGVDRVVLPDGSRCVARASLRDEPVRQSELAGASIDVQLKSVLPIVLWYDTERAQAEWYARSLNDAIQEDVEASNGRVLGMAHLPLPFPDLAIKEMERVATEYKFPAVQIGTNALGKNLDEPEFTPFWEAAERLGVLVFLHPNPPQTDRLRRYHLKNLIGNPLDTSIAIASLIFGGVLHRFPSLKLVFAHSGGYAPWIRGRWRHGYGEREEARVNTTTDFDELFAKLYFDTIIHDGPALEYLIETVGADRVVHGTDYPADMGDIEQVAHIRSLPNLSDEHKAAILGGNVLRLIGREAAVAA